MLNMDTHDLDLLCFVTGNATPPAAGPVEASPPCNLAPPPLSDDDAPVEWAALEAATLVDPPDEHNLDVPEWPVMTKAAFHGLAGDFVRLACRGSEADPAAVLATFLVRFGVECGPWPVLEVGDTKHRARLAAVIVGASSKARKGTSGKPVTRLFSGLLDPARSSPGPFSSGEGVIYAIRDPVCVWDKKKGEDVTVDPGVADKRLFVLDEEFAGVMANTKREGNTLSVIIRSAWDTGNLDPLTKHFKIKSTGAHVGWTSHVTLEELRRKLDDSEAFNGFSNRILWVCARRGKIVPFPVPMLAAELSVILDRMAEALAKIETEPYPIRWGDAAKAAWINKHYADLTKDNPGLVGCVINRAEAQVVRLAMIYCLLDGQKEISLEHLEAAMAFWSYCEQSARFIFHGRQADQTAQIILEAIKERDLTGSEVYALFNNHISKGRIETAISGLVASGQIVQEKSKTGGRPTIICRFQKTPREKRELSEISPVKSESREVSSLNSLNSQGSCENSNADRVEI